MPTVDTNMTDFEECAAVVLNTLFETFPQPIYLDPRMKDYRINDTTSGYIDWDKTGTLFNQKDVIHFHTVEKPDDQRRKKKERVDQALLNYEWTIRFLINEGFIRNTDENDEKFVILLTAKGLSILNAVPKVIKGKPISLIQRLHKALKGQSQEAIRDTITAIIAQSLIVAGGLTG
jgi:hypothetical protein